ncbi:helix-turn-helix domain-containing protein [Roseinatronobacter monicus]|uniref:Helix-turn-helix protein n=1 Tax=Roseinatronobacter monicus TaxID=393481 RepID=A0A543KIN1_9RHOB|nr:helix-turn-helix transcriptional regulator [Roseinatronobacter monicus]TQM94941.1 helix-turn-helix protein [Roseinatronobacter monicus]
MSGFRLPQSGSPKEIAQAEEEEAQRQGREFMVQTYSPRRGANENLRAFRMRHKLKMKDAASMMEVTARTYSDYEKGIRPVPSHALVKFAILTGGDLNEILLGRASSTKPEAFGKIVDEFFSIMGFLNLKYPDMSMNTRIEVARFIFKTDWRGMPHTHPEVIRDAVRITTRYQFHPEDIPAPPHWENYDDLKLYSEDTAAWQRMMAENRGRHLGDTSDSDQLGDR